MIHLAADLGKAVGQGGLAPLGVVFYAVYRVQGGRAVKAADHIGSVGRLLCLRNKLGQVLVLQAPIERGAVHTGGERLVVIDLVSAVTIKAVVVLGGFLHLAGGSGF